jgi:hypothetical protein
LRHLPKSSGKKKISKPKNQTRKRTKAEVTRSKKGPMKQYGTSRLSSYENWISRQVQDRVNNKTAERFRIIGTAMPKDTFEEWLGKQTPVENKVSENTSIPANAFDEWMKKQVEAKRSEFENERAGNEAEPEVPAS